MYLNFSGRPSGGCLIGIACCCGLLVLSGCNNSTPVLSNLVPVQGKVLLDGKPFPGGTVQFIPEGDPKAPIPQGEIQADGTYTLSTKGQAGAPPGKYRAVVHGGDEKKAKRLDRRYKQTDKSPLLIEVGENKAAGAYDLKLQSKR